MTDDLMKAIGAVQVKYIDELMQKAHVVGVGIGLAKVHGDYSETPALIVMVDKKVALSELAAADIIPTELDGVRVDVQETGVFTAF